jgi:hypothetical protein
MICRVFSDKNTEGWLLRIETDTQLGTPLAERTVRAIAPAGSGLKPLLPLPPSSESGRWTGKPHAAICDATDYQTIDSVYRRILENNPKSGEVALFGNYLTAVLLGPNLDILEASRTPLDLRLVFDDPSLQRMPWEMMYGPSENAPAGPSAPLSARPNKRFAINREVPLAPGEPKRIPPTSEGQLRVLFVAESKIDNVLRPGAEFLGLLRHLRVPANAQFQGDFVSADIKLRFLPESDVDQLKTECQRFQPSVLHFICHGQSDPGGGPSRIVLRIRPPGATEGETKPHAVTADELADLLTEDGGSIPPVIVLNACYTATLPDQPVKIEDVHLPFAARMVQRGAAMAVGMAGEVADPACQMFTLRFYQALLTRTPLVEAASQARRAVLTAWPAYQQSVEWSRPVLFVASGLDGTFDVRRDTTFDLQTAGERFRKDGACPRMMCDRYDMMVAYDRLMSLTDKPGAGQLLVAFAVQDGTKGLGKTRLLEEFATRSVIDGFLPCLLRAEGEMPRSLLDFALALSDAINDTRKNFGVNPVAETEARLLAIDALPAPPSPENRDRTLRSLRTQVGGMKNVDARAVVDAIQRDCAHLVADIRTVTKLSHRVLILIDEFHRWEGAYNEVLQRIDFAGFGTAADPVPVVLNYVVTSLEGQSIYAKLKSSLPAERRPELRRFDSDVERDMVYRQLLLSEWQCAPRQSREVRDRVKLFLAQLHTMTGGLPLMFLDPRLDWYVRGVKFGGETIVDADYEMALRTYGV